MASFDGGEKLRARLRAIADRVDKSVVLKAGIREGAGTYPDTNISIATVGAIHEFGAPSRGIPPRSFMRTTIRAKQKAWADEVAALLPGTDYDLNTVFHAVGEHVAADIQDTITAMKSPPLKEATVERKGFDALLVDTGLLRKSIDFEVTNE